MISRRDALRLGLAGLVGSACRRTGVVPVADAAPALGRMPVVFVGHGSPMNAIEDNAWSRAWRALGTALPQPRAILCVSAHWYVPGTWVTGNVAPRTIHDFGGFPKALFEVRYPAKGDVALAGRITSLLASHEARTRDDWGLDHGAWSVLARVRPAADVPVLQLSVHRGLAPEAHLALGRALAPLRDEGVLLLASGNVTHNLPHALSGDGQLPAWASAIRRRRREGPRAARREVPWQRARHGPRSRRAPDPRPLPPAALRRRRGEPERPDLVPVDGLRPRLDLDALDSLRLSLALAHASFFPRAPFSITDGSTGGHQESHVSEGPVR